MTLQDLTGHWTGFLAVLLFLVSYTVVILEDVIEIKKSKPVLLAAGLIWVLVAVGYGAFGRQEEALELARETIEEYAELFLFLFVAITYVSTLEERRVFDALRARLVAAGFSYRQLFWLTGALAFLLSPALDNLTTALVMGSVVLALGATSERFVTIACINIVVAANAGGAFSPFGDITTLMVWQAGKLPFSAFFTLLIPALLNWWIPAILMYAAVPRGAPQSQSERAEMLPGAKGVMLLFAASIATAISFKNFLHLPPALGMMLGLGYLQLWAFILQKVGSHRQDTRKKLDSFHQMQRVEWDTMLFFFGIIFAVGGLSAMGYLAVSSQLLYSGWGPTAANISIGIFSAIVDNIPLMFAVLKMNPDMSEGQWLLVTLTCGVGGSLLSIGSAAGVALMGHSRGRYTFSAHFKWSWAILVGYVLSVGAHYILNAERF